MKLTEKQIELLNILRKEKTPKSAAQMDRLLEKVKGFFPNTVNALLRRKLIALSYPRGFTLTDLGRTVEI